jgi:hypothetical protein
MGTRNKLEQRDKESKQENTINGRQSQPVNADVIALSI